MDTDAANSGLFSATGDTSTIKNLKLKNSYFKGPNVVGSIAGKPNGTFKNIYSDAIVEGTGDIATAMKEAEDLTKKEWLNDYNSNLKK